jgi:hypothetical protein
MKLKLTASAVFCLFLIFSAAAQDKPPVKFGNVSEKDFAPKYYAIDSNASAVVIADIGSCKLEGNNKGWFSAVNRHYKRVHILNKNGYDIADVSIYLYSNGQDDEKLDRLKAVTYNLENGKVVETKLEMKSSVFDDKLDKNRKVKKFTFPNIKEGSIIEFEYTTISDFIHSIDPWEFQGSYPRLWSEFTFTSPSFFNYTFLTQGYLKFDINTTKEGGTVFNVTMPNTTGPSERFSLNANTVDTRWVIKNVPALKEEGFTSSINNHIQKLDFHLVEQRDPLRYYRYIESWPQVAKNLLESEYFGQSLKRDNGWLKDIVNPLVTTSASKEQKAGNIFTWVRDHFTCTDYHRRTMDQTLKNLVKSKNGTVAEINLLLTAMLKYAGIEADPVILSTRSHGISYPIFPLMNQYDYVITRVVMEGKPIYLDASEPTLGFGHLPLRCFNGHARVINENAEAIELNSDELMESKNTIVFIINNEKGKMIGSMQQTAGYYESGEIRERIKEKGTEQLQKDIKKDFGSEIEISNFGIDSLGKYDFPVHIHYDFDIKDEMPEIIYLNPLFGEGYKDNPFKSAERKYPVEMPYGMDETYNLQLEVPTGYIVDELPKSMVLKLNEEEESIFEYRVSQSGNTISLRSRVKLVRANYAADEYELLREFFSIIVKKQAEQIVFKKQN